jgi:hypothetical protein
MILPLLLLQEKITRGAQKEAAHDDESENEATFFVMIVALIFGELESLSYVLCHGHGGFGKPP